MISPTEKAKEIFDLFIEPTQQYSDKELKWIDDWRMAKQCATISVDIILNHLITKVDVSEEKYWKMVREDIERI